MGTRLLLDMSRLVTAGAAWITSGRARSVSSQTSADPELAPARMPPATHVSGTARMDRLRISTAHGQNVLMRVTPVPADPGGTGQARTNGNRCGWRAAESKGQPLPRQLPGRQERCGRRGPRRVEQGSAQQRRPDLAHRVGGGAAAMRLRAGSDRPSRRVKAVPVPARKANANYPRVRSVWQVGECASHRGRGGQGRPIVAACVISSDCGGARSTPSGLLR